MAYKISKSKEFLRTVLAVLHYIENEWGLKSAQKFQTVLDTKLIIYQFIPKQAASQKIKIFGK